jgi:ribonuclease HI
MMRECTTRTAIAFTDGSYQPNPGPCGAGSYIVLPNKEAVELAKPISRHSTILLGELVAIQMTLEYIVREVNCDWINTVHVFSDSQSVIRLLTLGWKPRQFFDTLERTKSCIRQLEAKETLVEILWSPGHADIHGNERADRLSKEASTRAASMYM